MLLTLSMLLTLQKVEAHSSTKAGELNGDDDGGASVTVAGKR